jgi:hypothetical protein
MYVGNESFLAKMALCVKLTTYGLEGLTQDGLLAFSLPGPLGLTDRSTAKEKVLLEDDLLWRTY